jgi:hypothetical protein
MVKEKDHQLNKSFRSRPDYAGCGTVSPLKELKLA